MAALSSFFPMVAPMVPGAPDIAIENAALYGAIEFCTRTLTLTRTLAAVPTVAGQAPYVLVQPDEVVVKLLGVKIDGKPIELLTPTALDGQEDLTTWQTSTNALLSAPMILQLYPRPLVAGQQIVVRAAMRPAQAATSVADDVFERHAQAIADYAAYWLMSQPQAAYAKPREASAPMARFHEAVAAEKERVFRAHARTRTRVAVNWC